MWNDFRRLAFWGTGRLLIVVCSAVLGCSSTVDNSTEPQWVIQSKPTRKKIALVYVHGIFGDALGTWKSASGSSLIDYVATDSRLKVEADAYAFGFTSKMIGQGSFSVRTAANKLAQKLDYDRIDDYETVVFVAHSMGGLVVLRYLLDNPEKWKKTPVVFFYATPFEGADIATLANRVSSNRALADMIPTGNNSWLEQLLQDWNGKDAAARPKVRCAHETISTGPTLVVNWNSATRICYAGPSDAISANHLNIVKPDRPSHDAVMLLVNALNKYVSGSSVAAVVDMPDFVHEKDDLVFTIGRGANFASARLSNRMSKAVTLTVANLPQLGGLRMFPETPLEIDANKTQKLDFVVTRGVLSPEYRLRLKLGSSSEELALVVRIPDVVEQEVNRVSVEQALGEDLKALRISVGRGRIEEKAVLAAVEKRMDTAYLGMAKPLQLVAATEMLSALQYHDVAQLALSQIASSAATYARSENVQSLSTLVAANARSDLAIRQSAAARFRNDGFIQDRFGLGAGKAAASVASERSRMQR